MRNIIFTLLFSLCPLLILCQQNIDLSFDSTPLPDGTSFAYGSTYTGGSVINYFTIENTGDADLTFATTDPIIINGASASDFILDGDLSGLVLPPDEKTFFSITFQPTTTGASTATATIASDDPDLPSYELGLEGQGLDPMGDCLVPNGDFEHSYRSSVAVLDIFSGEITGVKSYQAPTGWSAFSSLLLASFFGTDIGIDTTADAQNGMQAIELRQDGFGSADLLTQLKCSSTIQSLRGRYKFDGAPTDSAIVAISTGGGEETNRTNANSDTLYIDTNSSSFTEFEIPVPYDASSVDSLLIYMTTTGNNPGFAFTIDDLELVNGVSEFRPFITTWKTDNPGTSSNTQITIPTEGAGYDYDVYWEEVGNSAVNGTLTGLTGDATIDFPAPGTYRLEISGDFPRIKFISFTGDREKILTVEQWGDLPWTSMERAFEGCTHLTVPATDVPDLSGVTDMSLMFFRASSLNQDIGNWDVSNVTKMTSLLAGAEAFDQDIGNWDVSNVTNMSGMFTSAKAFNQDLGSWDVSNVINMANMFAGADAFNQNIGNWSVGSVTNMAGMFLSADAFDQDIGGWDVSSVTSMRDMFGMFVAEGAFLAHSFNQDIGSWNVSNVTDMGRMFFGARAFDQDLGNWDVSNVTFMDRMFEEAHAFNGDISNWNVGSVTNMVRMFYNTFSFDQNIGDWDVSNVTTMFEMFFNAGSFNQDIGNWDITKVTDMELMFFQGGLSTQNYDQTLIGWSSQGVQNGVRLGVNGLSYCNGKNAREVLINDFNWNITGDAESAPIANFPVLQEITAECSLESIDAPTAVDPCDGSEVIGTQSLPLPILESTIITWTFEGTNGNSSVQTQNVIIEDTTPPLANAGNLADLTNECSVDMPEAPLATDNCNGQIIGTTDITFPVTSSTTITWIFTDESGNTSTQAQNVIIEDTTPPLADAASLDNLTSECIIESIEPPTATDNCVEQVIATTKTSFPITSSTIVTWTYEDASGNTSTQTQQVTIEDKFAPVPDVAFLPDVIQECAYEQPESPRATDNCDGVIEGIPSVSFPLNETSTITWTYTDASGNISTQDQNVFILDTSAPVPDVQTLATLSGDCSVSAPASPTATDNCGGIIMGIADVGFPVLESTEITWTYSDASGNITRQTQNVIIQDNSAPVPDASILDDLTGNCQVETASTPTATDNCDGQLSATTVTVFPVTETSTITWTFTDSNGNMTTQTQNVIITSSAPVPQIANLEDLTGNCSVEMSTTPLASDECDGNISATADTDFPITTLGTTTVTWTYTDSNGNETTQTQNVTVTDDTAPVADATSLPDLSGECELAMPDAPTATDDCEGTIIGIADVEFPLTETGRTVITWTFQDASGNVTTQTQNVTVSCGPLSILNPMDTEIQAYPNPTSDYLEVDWAGNQSYLVQIHNLSGELMKRMELKPQQSIDLRDLATGIYILRLKEPQGKFVGSQRIAKK